MAHRALIRLKTTLIMRKRELADQMTQFAWNRVIFPIHARFLHMILRKAATGRLNIHEFRGIPNYQPVSLEDRYDYDRAPR